MADDSSFIKGLESRLNGDFLDFDLKIRLCRNVIFSVAPFEALNRKTEIVLRWILSRLEFKNARQSVEVYIQKVQLWDLFSSMALKSSDFESGLESLGSSLSEILLNVLSSGENEEESLRIKMALVSNKILNSKILQRILKMNSELFIKIIEIELRYLNKKSENILSLIPKLDSISDSFLTFLSTNFPENFLVLKMNEYRYFSEVSLIEWSQFLELLLEEKDLKPPSSVTSKISIIDADFLRRSPLSFKSCPWDENSEIGRLFIFFVWCLGYNPMNLIKEDSVWTVSIQRPVIDSSEKSEILKKLLSSLKLRTDFSWNTILLNDTTFLKWSQYLLKVLSLSQDFVSFTPAITVLGQINPSVLEPLIGSIVSKFVFDVKGDSGFIFCLKTYSSLRLIPKLFAKLFIYLKNNNNNDAPRQIAISSNALESFGSEVEGIPSSQALELWKTFLFHLGDDESVSFLSVIDAFFSIFLSRIHILNHSVPQITVDKVEDLVLKTSKYLDSIPLSCSILLDFILLFKNLRGWSKGDEILQIKSNQLHRIKLDEINGVKNILSASSMNVYENLNLFLPRMNETDIEKTASELIESDNLSSESLEALEESRELQKAYVKVLLDRMTPYLSSLKDCLKSSFKSSKKPVINNCKYLLRLPLEHLSSDVQIKILDIILRTLMSEEFSTDAFKVLARTLDSQKSTELFRDFDIALTLLKLFSNKKFDDSFESYDKICLESLVKLSTKFSKTSLDIQNKTEEFVKHDHLLASILDNFSLAMVGFNEETNPEKYASFKDIISNLAKGVLSKVQSDLKDNEIGVLQLLRSMSGVFRSIHSSKKLSKWSTSHIQKYVYFAVDSDHKYSFAFLTALIKRYSVFSEYIDVESIWKKVESDISFNEQSRGLLLELINVPDTEISEKFLQKLNDKTWDYEEKNKLRYISIWNSLIEGNSTFQNNSQKYLEKSLCYYHQAIVMSVLTFQEIIGVLKMENLVLNSEKALVSKEIEAACMIGPLTSEFKNLNLEEFNELWTGSFFVLVSIFKKRYFLLPSRIPLVLDIFSNLIDGLIRISDQNTPKTFAELKILSLRARDVERISEFIVKRKDDFARTAPYFISNILEGFRKISVHQTVKSILIFSVYKLLDICDVHSIDFLGASLSPESSQIFKNVLEDYKKYHKYSGRV